MTDKERILTALVRELRTTFCLAKNPKGWGEEHFEGRGGSGVYTHFAPWITKLTPGMLVLCETMMLNEFSIGIVVSQIASDTCIIREIGTSRECKVGNENFTPIIGMSEEKLLEGDKYLFRIKLLKALRKADDYWHRFGGVRFDGDKAIITVCERYGGMLSGDKESVPYEIEIPWSKRASIKSIVAAMLAQGFGKREFVRKTSETTPTPSDTHNSKNI